MVIVASPHLPHPVCILKYAAATAKSLQSCPTLCDPVDIDGSPPGSPVPGILLARTLEWVAISFSNAWMFLIAWINSPGLFFSWVCFSFTLVFGMFPLSLLIDFMFWMCRILICIQTWKPHKNICPENCTPSLILSTPSIWLTDTSFFFTLFFLPCLKITLCVCVCIYIYNVSLLSLPSLTRAYYVFLFFPLFYWDMIGNIVLVLGVYMCSFVPLLFCLPASRSSSMSVLCRLSQWCSIVSVYQSLFEPCPSLSVQRVFCSL